MRKEEEKFTASEAGKRTIHSVTPAYGGWFVFVHVFGRCLCAVLCMAKGTSVPRGHLRLNKVRKSAIVRN